MIMEPYIKTQLFKSAKPLAEDYQEKLRSSLPDNEDFRIIYVTETDIKLEFNTYLYSDTGVVKLLQDEGFIIQQKKNTGFWKGKIDALAQSNKKNFGNQKLDCCQLSK